MTIRSIFPSEHQIQCAIVEWANIFTIEKYEQSINGGLILIKRKIIDYLLAVPNGGNRSITEALRLKREGVKRGVSDLFFAHPSFGRGFFYHGLWIEVKSKKGKLRKEQKEWMLFMSNVGYKCVEVRTVDEGIQAIKDYLGMR
jgi:hypothetical protein